MRKNNDVNMLSGSITKGLIAICAPVMIMNVIQSLFSLVDMAVLKAFDTDGMAVGAVGVCTSMITLITNLVVGIAAGANVVIARYIGQQHHRHVDRAVGTAITFSVVAGIALGVLGVVFAQPLLRIINCPQELFDGAVLYFRLYFAGVPILLLYNFASNAMRASGNSRVIMIISLVGAGVKLVATYVFTGFLRLGITGVALGTITSWCAYAGLSVLYLLRNHGTVRLYRQRLGFHKPELPYILRIGIPSGIQMGLFAVANVAITAAVNDFGPQASTGISIANTFDGILYYICTAASLAVMPYVSQNIGAGNVDRAAKSVRKSILLTLVIGVGFGALAVIFSRQMAGLMTDDPVVVDYACQKMVIISSTYFICGICDIFAAALRGMGKSVFPTVVALIFMCGLRFAWVYLVFPHFPNMTFLYFVWPLSWVACIVSMLFVYFPTKKQLKQICKRRPEIA